MDKSRVCFLTLEDRFQPSIVSGEAQDTLFRSLHDVWESGPCDRYWFLMCEEGQLGSGQHRYERLWAAIREEHARQDWSTPKIDSLVFPPVSFRSTLDTDEVFLKFEDRLTLPESCEVFVVLSAPFWAVNRALLVFLASEQLSRPFGISLDYAGSSGVVSAKFPAREGRFSQGTELLDFVEKVDQVMDASWRRQPVEGTDQWPEEMSVFGDVQLDDEEAVRLQELAATKILAEGISRFCTGISQLLEGEYGPALVTFQRLERYLVNFPDLRDRSDATPAQPRPLWMVFFASRFLAEIAQWVCVDDEYASYRQSLADCWMRGLSSSLEMTPTQLTIRTIREGVLEMRRSSMFSTGWGRPGYDSSDREGHRRTYRSRPILFPDRADDDSRFLAEGQVEASLLSGDRNIEAIFNGEPSAWESSDLLVCTQILGLYLLDETRASTFTVLPCAPDGSRGRTVFDTMPGGAEWMQHLAILAFHEHLLD